MLLHDMMSDTRYMARLLFWENRRYKKISEFTKKKKKKTFYYKFNICPTSPEFQIDGEYLNLDLSRSRSIFQSANICLSPVHDFMVFSFHMIPELERGLMDA